jgi:inosose dehydratase
MTRRAFSKTALLGLSAVRAAPGALKKRGLKPGHTGLTWIPLGGGPAATPGPNPMLDPQYVEAAIRDIASLGFYGLELFGNQIEAMEAQGGVGALLEKHNLPLVSAYCSTNLMNPAQRQDAIGKTLGWARLVKKYNGKIVVVGPNGVKRDSYNFQENKANIVATLNELGRRVSELGLTAVLHQHTGTCVESRDETYAVMEAINTEFIKFGPDIGQLQKGGSDPVQVVKDFLPIVHHMHLKDYSGGERFLGYCPLGEGKVNIPAILDLMEGRKIAGRIMVELDSPPPQPMPAIETARIAKSYLENQGIQFRS